MTTLTINEIKELAGFAGLQVDSHGLTEEDMEAQLTIEPCPKDGVAGDNGEKIKYTGSIAYFTEIPEEGCMPLGEPVEESSTEFGGTVTVKVKPGMKARINPAEIEGKIHEGKEFVVAGEPRDLSGTEVVALNNLDGSKFSAGYDLSMLQITEIPS